MQQIELILVLYVAVAVLAYLARRLQVPYPLLLVIGGLAMSRVPHLPHIAIQPNYIFLVFLPPLLYYSALHTSWRDFRANLRPIGMLSIGLTLFTMIAVAVVVRWVVPGFSWAVAFVLGAIISPTDAIAATAIAMRMGVPEAHRHHP